MNPGLGHNRGPPLEESSSGPTLPRTYNAYSGRKAHAAAWRHPPYDVVLLRLRRARALGMSYRGYTSVILDRRVYLQPPKVNGG